MQKLVLILFIAVFTVGLVNAQTAKSKSLTLTVSGMKCENCVAKVDKALRGVEGVKDVTVDLKKQSAIVTFASTAVKPEVLYKAVKDVGFEVSVGKPSSKATSKDAGCTDCKEGDAKDAKKGDCCKPETTTKKAAPKS